MHIRHDIEKQDFHWTVNNKLIIAFRTVKTDNDIAYKAPPAIFSNPVFVINVHMSSSLLNIACKVFLIEYWTVPFPVN